LAGGTGMLASGGNPTDPSFLLTAALTYGAARGQRAVSNSVNQDMARRIAEMLVSGDEAAYRAAVRQVANGPFVQSLRSLTAELGRGARGAGAGLAAGKTMAHSAGSAPFTHEEPEQMRGGWSSADPEHTGPLMRSIGRTVPGYEPGPRESENVEDRRSGFAKIREQFFDAYARDPNGPQARALGKLMDDMYARDPQGVHGPGR
jgi:hypothetical protein